MTPLPQVKQALQQAQAHLPYRDRLSDLAYLLDADPDGTEALILYVKVRRGASLPPKEKREVESYLRTRLKSGGFPVYFRWYLESEEDGGELIATDTGLLGKPVSALH